MQMRILFHPLLQPMEYTTKDSAAQWLKRRKIREKRAGRALIGSPGSHFHIFLYVCDLSTFKVV